MDDPQAVDLFINGAWRPGRSGRTRDVHDPATDSPIGTVACADREDLDEALQAAAAGFAVWRSTSALERGTIMRRAAGLVRERAEDMALLMSREQGKPLAEARIEIVMAAEIVEWFAEEARRTYGRVIPARQPNVSQLSLREPVGPVAAFTPWNFPVNQVVRKLSPALAAGCSIVIKGPEETPMSPAAFVRCFQDAGVPPGVVNLVYGDPAGISSYLIPHPVIRKVSFTGSVAVGKHLAALAGQHMKRATMELGGHGPAIVCKNADLDAAVSSLVFAKFRNSGQVCVSPTRFIVEDSVFDRFVDRFVAAARTIEVGNGQAEGTRMGPLINARRLDAVTDLVADAAKNGATIVTGGRRIGNVGNFFEPTVLTDLDPSMRVMNEEPFGPLALMMPFGTLDEAVSEANRLPYGLAAYAWTGSAATAARLGAEIETGMLTINHLGLGLAELPFGGVKDSGYGSEGGTEAMDAYLAIKAISRLN